MLTRRRSLLVAAIMVLAVGGGTVSGVTVSGGFGPDARDRLVYVWSEQMPLSVEGMPHAEAAAGALGARFEPVELDAAHARAGPAGTLPAEVAGAALHVPSTALVSIDDAGERVRTVLGYKTGDGLLHSLAGAVEVRVGRSGLDGAVPSETRAVRRDVRTVPPDGGGPPADVRWVGEPEPGFPGFFYRMIPGTSQFVLDRRGSTYVHDTETGVRWTGPADLDLVPSPDATFLVAPVDDALAFYSWAELREIGPVGGGADLPPFHLDEEMDDQYPSVGILGQVDGGTHVRVLVSWFAGVKVRDYTVGAADDGTMRVQPRGDVVRPCPDVRLSTPILAPDGRHVSGRDESTATTRVFRIGASGRECEAVADVGFATSKATFSPSARYLTFSRWVPGADGRVAQVHVLDLRSGSTRPVEGATSSRLLIPDFGTEEEILMLRVEGETRFEIHCWRGMCPTG